MRSNEINMKLEQSEKFFVEGRFRKSIEKNAIPVQKFKNIDVLTGDASTRRYYRINTDIDSFVVCLSDPLKEKKAKSDFVTVQNLLERHSVKVPRILDKELDKGYYLQEDLGDKTLLSYNSSCKSKEDEFDIYTRILDELIKIHSIKLDDVDENYSKLAFDSKKLMQEMQVTNEYFLKKYLALNLTKHEEEFLNESFKQICDKIETQKMVLTHRDYHSRNVMVKDGEFVIIDFQDARRGIPQYDLVSMLEDCYYQINKENVTNLKKYYWTNFLEQQKIQKTYEEFEYFYDLMAIQRVYKAIGSFSYIYETRKDTRYLKYIGFAFEKIRKILRNHDEFKELGQFLSKKYYEC